MRKAVLIITAFIIAFGINELFVRYVIGYPTQGIDKQIRGIGDLSGSYYLSKPYSKYWNVEGGNITEYRNNYGLPGNDIIITDSTKKIILLGNSYLTATQVKKEKMASTIFQKELKKIDSNYYVINLAADGHDVYGLYLRMKYFENIFDKPYKVILVLTDDNVKLLKRNKDIKFENYEKDWKENKTLSFQTQKIIRNTFASVNLLRHLDRDKKEAIEIENKTKDGIASDRKSNNYYSQLDSVLLKFKENHGRKFIVLSISNDTELNEHLKQLLEINSIYFSTENIIKFENIFLAHLNEKGNNDLGLFMYKVFKNTNKDEKISD